MGDLDVIVKKFYPHFGEECVNIPGVSATKRQVVELARQLRVFQLPLRQRLCISCFKNPQVRKGRFHQMCQSCYKQLKRAEVLENDHAMQTQDVARKLVGNIRRTPSDSLSIRGIIDLWRDLGGECERCGVRLSKTKSGWKGQEGPRLTKLNPDKPWCLDNLELVCRCCLARTSP